MIICNIRNELTRDNDIYLLYICTVIYIDIISAALRSSCDGLSVERIMMSMLHANTMTLGVHLHL